MQPVHANLQHAESSSSLSDSGVILLDPMPLKQAMASCESLSETIWKPSSGPSSIKSDLDYLVYQRKYSPSQHYWIAPVRGAPSTINADGDITKAAAHTHLPVLCTQSAPYSTEYSSNTSSTWQVAVQSNNEHITG